MENSVIETKTREKLSDNRPSLLALWEDYLNASQEEETILENYEALEREIGLTEIEENCPDGSVRELLICSESTYQDCLDYVAKYREKYIALKTQNEGNKELFHANWDISRRKVGTAKSRFRQQFEKLADIAPRTYSSYFAPDLTHPINPDGNLYHLTDSHTPKTYCGQRCNRKSKRRAALLATENIWCSECIAVLDAITPSVSYKAKRSSTP